MNIDALIEAGLYDPDGPGASDRLALLEHLDSQGVGMDELVEADARGRLVFAVSDRALFPSGDLLTVKEVADGAGVTLERVVRLRMAAGLPADPMSVVTAGFAGTIGAFEDAAAVFGEEATLAFTRVVGAAVRRITEAATTLFSAEVAPELTTELQYAQATEMARGLAATLPPVMEALLWEHWYDLGREPAGAGLARSHAGEERHLAVGFVDLAGSTAWSEELSLRDHAVALARFDAAAWNAAVTHGARVVKMIGDEAMFVAADPAGLVRAALELCRIVHDDPDLPESRGAISYGSVLSRDGDYFGSIVNLASRCVRLARPGSVVVTDNARHELEASDWARGFEPQPPQVVAGLSDPVTVFRVA